jgi:hypothetical protein
MQRDKHQFQFTGNAISKAASEECEYHKDRVTWWKTEQETAINRAKEAGLEVREYAYTGGKGVQVVLDPSLASRLHDCALKITAHQKAADAFHILMACYGSQGERVYELHPDDVIYFRLAGGPREE